MAYRKIRALPKLPKLEQVDLGVRKELLVGTIFAKDSALQRSWFDLQLRFLAATTHNYDHVTVLYNETDSDYFSEKSEVFRVNPFTSDDNSKSHLFGLNYLINIFLSRRHCYKKFLILDSDAFPIRTDWQDLLSKNMQDRLVAIPIRTEDLETRIHASIVYLKNEAIDGLEFKIQTSGLDLIGDPECDIVAGKFEEDRHGVFTMVRSNKYNIHPVLCGVYYDCFYHHCFGSGRKYNIRAKDYWSNICDKDINVNSYTNELMSNTNDFIEKLAGWCPERYAKI